MTRLLLICAVLLALPATAHASRDSRLNALGDRVFGPAPCGYVATVWANPIDYFQPAETPAWAGTGECFIYINEADRDLDAPFLCQRWLHERGHVAGLHHSRNPRSIMYPVKNEVSVWPGWSRHRIYRVDRRCKRFGL